MYFTYFLVVLAISIIWYFIISSSLKQNIHSLPPQEIIQQGLFQAKIKDNLQKSKSLKASEYYLKYYYREDFISILRELGKQVYKWEQNNKSVHYQGFIPPLYLSRGAVERDTFEQQFLQFLKTENLVEEKAEYEIARSKDEYYRSHSSISIDLARIKNYLQKQ